MKLRFAFGSIRKTEELLDLRVFDGHAIELRGGAFVRRIGVNRYEFLYDGRPVEVDVDSLARRPTSCPTICPRRAISPRISRSSISARATAGTPDRPCMASLVQIRTAKATS